MFWKLKYYQTWLLICLSFEKFVFYKIWLQSRLSFVNQIWLLVCLCFEVEISFDLAAGSFKFSKIHFLIDFQTAGLFNLKVFIFIRIDSWLVWVLKYQLLTCVLICLTFNNLIFHQLWLLIFLSFETSNIISMTAGLHEFWKLKFITSCCYFVWDLNHYIDEIWLLICLSYARSNLIKFDCWSFDF